MKVFLQYRERTNIIRTVRTTGDFRKAEISVKTVECKTARCEIERFGNCKYKKNNNNNNNYPRELFYMY